MCITNYQKMANNRIELRHTNVVFQITDFTVNILLILKDLRATRTKNCDM